MTQSGPSGYEDLEPGVNSIHLQLLEWSQFQTTLSYATSMQPEVYFTSAPCIGSRLAITSADIYG